MSRALVAVNRIDQSGPLLSLVKTMDPDSVILVHVRTTGKPAESRHQNDPNRTADNVMNFYRKELEEDRTITVSTQVREGDPSREILLAAREEDVDIIVLGRAASRLRRLVTGSTAAEVERNAKVSVLVSSMRGTKKSHVYDWRGEVYASQ